MKLNKNLAERLELPSVSQIGIVTGDLEKTVNYYEKVLGLKPFIMPKIVYKKKHYYGKAVDSEWLMAFSSLGPVELEIIQPLTGPTVYHDYLKENGDGIHHLGFDVKDIEKKLEIFTKMGIKNIQGGEGETSRFEYFDTAEIGGVTIELLQRKSRRA
jgi:methylmalonyl-CoA/ethylmalonyl-CoA epimerase